MNNLSMDKTDNIYDKFIGGLDCRMVELLEFSCALRRESDRGCALFAAAYLDEALAKLLRSRIVESKSKDDDIFGKGRLLSSFSSRILMTFHLGLISDACRKNLNLIRKIRNDFAHRIDKDSFDDESVSNRCREFSFTFREKGDCPRKRFISTVIGILACIDVEMLKIRRINEKADDSPNEETKRIHGLLIGEFKNYLSEDKPSG